MTSTNIKISLRKSKEHFGRVPHWFSAIECSGALISSLGSLELVSAIAVGEFLLQDFSPTDTPEVFMVSKDGARDLEGKFSWT